MDGALGRRPRKMQGKRPTGPLPVLGKIDFYEGNRRISTFGCGKCYKLQGSTALACTKYRKLRGLSTLGCSECRKLRGSRALGCTKYRKLRGLSTLGCTECRKLRGSRALGCTKYCKLRGLSALGCTKCHKLRSPGAATWEHKFSITFSTPTPYLKISFSL